MSKPFEIYWTAVAETDLLGILEYIAHDNPNSALAVYRRIKAQADKLDRSPNRGRIVPELLRHGISRYREIINRPWRLIYRIEGTRVYVVSLIDGRRNVEDVLLERLLR